LTADRQTRFRTLWESERSRIAAYAIRRTNSVEDAADVVADTFSIAWRRLDEVPAGENALPWLYTTARNVIANQRRGLRRHSALIERLGNQMTSAMVFDDALDEESLSARRLLLSLPDPDREVLMLSSWEGLDAREIGHVLGCSTVAARLRLHRARARMQRDSMIDEVWSKRATDLRQIRSEATTE
jgi:RNA polymerase sigma factor (sigma-70 family)